MKKKVRIIVVDDSVFMRRLLVEILESVPNFEVIKTASDGIDALKAIEKYKPDVVTLDIEMPEIDGIIVLIYIMDKFPTPVVMISGFSSFSGEQTIKALEYGAVGFIRKPHGKILSNLAEIRQDLIEQVIIASRVDIRKLSPVKIKYHSTKNSKSVEKSSYKLVVFASSSGGPRAISQIVSELPRDFNAGVVIVQHMPDGFIESFAERLDKESQLKVKVAENGDPITKGQVLIAPANHYSRIIASKKYGGKVKLTRYNSKEKSMLISADETMISVASIYGTNAIGVVLTGMGNDGTKGFKQIKESGGFTIAEDKSTAVVFGMPKEAINAGVVDIVLTLHKIVDTIVKRVNRK